MKTELRVESPQLSVESNADFCPWQKSLPPKDRPIVAIGKIMIHDEWSTAALPFCDAIEWKEVGGHSDWYLFYSEGPMTLRRALDEEVIVHAWLPMPIYPKEAA